MDIKAYNYDQLDEIKDLIILFRNNKGSYFKDIKSIEDCRERFIKWEKSYRDYASIEEINYQKLFEIFTTDHKAFKTLTITDDIFTEQQVYVMRMYDSCRQWYVIAYYHGQPYCGVFLFQCRLKPKIFIMQAICRFHVPFLYNLLHPLPKNKIKVNDIMIPFIENFVRTQKGEILYVAPLIVQERILLRDHHFQKVPLDSNNNFFHPDHCPDACQNLRNMIDIQTYLGGNWIYKIL